MVEVKERLSAVAAKVKMYFRVVNTGLPEAVEDVRALWVKEWVVREEFVGTTLEGAEPGRRVGNCVVIMSEIVEGSVWTRLVHDFVSFVGGEGRVAMVQKRSLEGRGMVVQLVGGSSQGLWAEGGATEK